jgi:hypothetical protein
MLTRLRSERYWPDDVALLAEALFAKVTFGGGSRDDYADRQQ